jgi:peptide chain release factor subunit 1
MELPLFGDNIMVQLPKKHGRGGQSAKIFALLRKERRHAYVKQVAELATQCFITNDKANFTGIFMAYSEEDFKNVVIESDSFDARLTSTF